MDEITRRMLINDDKIAEGYFPRKYKCSQGVWTIGYGRAETNGLRDFEKEMLNVSSYRELSYLDENEATILLENDIDYFETLVANEFDFYYKLPQFAKYVLTDCAFNMGMTRLRKFKGMLNAIENNDWFNACKECIDSKYFSQVRRRSLRNALILITGDINIGVEQCDEVYNILKKRIK